MSEIAIESEEESYLQVGESRGHNVFDTSTLGSGRVWWQGVVLDASASTHTRGKHVLLVENTSADLTGVQIGDVLVVFAESVMSFFDDGVEEVGENLVRLFVTGNATDRGDTAWMSGVINSGLDHLVQGESTGCFQISELSTA